MKVLKIGNPKLCINKTTTNNARNISPVTARETLSIQVPVFMGNIVNSADAGLDGIFGYYEEKEFIQKCFIDTLLNANISNNPQKENIPNGIVFFGPSGGGKTFFSDKLSEELERKNIKVIKQKKYISKEKNDEEIKKAFQYAKKLHKQTDEYVALRLSTDIASLNNVSELLKDSATNGVVWIGETNQVQKVDSSLLNSEARTLKIPLYTMSDNETKQILEQILNSNSIKYDFSIGSALQKLKNLSVIITPANCKFWLTELIDTVTIRNKALTQDEFVRFFEQKYFTNPRYEEQSRKFKKDTDFVKNIDSENLFLGLVRINGDNRRNIEALLLPKYSQEAKTDTVDNLPKYEKENNLTRLLLASKEMGLDIDSLQNAKINGTSVIDYWITLDDKEDGLLNYTPRLKRIKFGEILQDENKVQEYIKSTLDKIEKTDILIKSARQAYTDIIENEPDITSQQREILIKQQESRLFFLVITNKVKSGEISKIQKNTIIALRQLSREREIARQNAQENIFLAVRNAKVLNNDSEGTQQKVDYIFKLLNHKTAVSSAEEKEVINQLVQRLERARINGNSVEFENNWTALVQIAQDYFNKYVLDDLTNQNVEMLNSINKNAQTAEPNILKAINDPSISRIEQKDFILRHKNDRNFADMLHTIDFNLGEEIDNLLYYEKTAKDVMYMILGQEYSGDVLDKKFKYWCQTDLVENLNKQYVEIKNRKFNIVTGKLDAIDNSINARSELIIQTLNEQTDVVRAFADNVSSMQMAQLSVLTKISGQLDIISQNALEIKQYMQVITRKQLLELEKDKYYKEIVPELTKLLPQKDQINIQDFLLQVDKLAKKEKSAIRRKKILKAALIIAGVAAAGVAIYYAGPSVVAYLSSGLSPDISTGIVSLTTHKADVAKMIGNSSLMDTIPFGSASKKEAIEALKQLHSSQADSIIRGIKNGDIRYSDYDSYDFKRTLSGSDKIRYEQALKQIKRR